jgi:hypothetical protein
VWPRSDSRDEELEIPTPFASARREEAAYLEALRGNDGIKFFANADDAPDLARLAQESLDALAVAARRLRQLADEIDEIAQTHNRSLRRR